MIYEGWATLGDSELWNAQRTYTYAMEAGLRPKRLNMKKCPPTYLNALLGDAPYTDPVSDAAPWYDATIPESAGFAGLWVESLEGFDGRNVSREVSPGISDGGVLGRLRRNPREVLVTGWLIGDTCCSVSYGLRWLAAALAHPTACSDACGGCDGDRLCFLRCLPQSNEVGLPACFDGTVSDPGEIAAVAAAADRYERHAYDVGVVEGPTVVEQVGMGCGCCGCAGIVRVEFRLVAANPWVYLTPDECLPATPFDLSGASDVCNITWVDADLAASIGLDCNDLTGVQCESEVNCLQDPLCPTPPSPPQPPQVPTTCVCAPITTTRLCCTATAGDWFDSTAVVEVYGGTTGLRNLFLRAFRNPLGFDADYFSECEACATLAISYVPPFSTLRIDGVSRRITLDCPQQQCIPGDALVFGDDGQPFSWIDLECLPTLICVDADSSQTAVDATLAIDVVGREPV